jgi:hypothetical protein
MPSALPTSNFHRPISKRDQNEPTSIEIGSWRIRLYGLAARRTALPLALVWYSYCLPSASSVTR